MKGDKFLEMMTQDLTTLIGNNKDLYSAVVEVMKAVVLPSFEIADDKGFEACYKYMEAYARANKVRCMGMELSKKVVSEYLEIDNGAATENRTEDIGFIDLADFM